MTYVLNPILEKVKSPVSLLLPDGSMLQYEDGTAAARATFNRRYAIDEIHASGDVVKVVLCELEGPTINWIGEEAVATDGVSFF